MEVGGGKTLLVECLPPRREWPDIGELLERPAAPQAAGLTDEGQSRVLPSVGAARRASPISSVARVASSSPGSSRSR